MRAIVAVCIAFLIGAGAYAQEPSSESGPFTREEAAQLRAVWSDIRDAESFESIDWQSVGLEVAPGDAEARRLMAANWGNLREAERFGDINWEATTGYLDEPRSVARSRDSGYVPLTRREADLMSAVWSEVRRAASFDDIDWEAVGLIGPPGDAEARRLMADHWQSLRRESRFSDIDWESLDETSFGNRRTNELRSEHGPFTSEEAAQLGAVWPQISQAESFDDIDWEAAGLDVAPGDARARTLMADHWPRLRTAARFDDIDWATTGYRGRD